jgi:hypothetical protein
VKIFVTLGDARKVKARCHNNKKYNIRGDSDYQGQKVGLSTRTSET